MAELTLLEMTQNVLSSLDSDEVNSISDTTESLQVATIIKNKYYDILARGSLPEQEILFQLDPPLDVTKPVLMYVPNKCSHIEWIKYFDSSTFNSQSETQFSHDLNVDLDSSPDSDNSPAGYRYVTILPIEQFLDMINRFNPLDPSVASFTFTEHGENFTFYYKNNLQPKYCCVIETKYVVFDAYDDTQDDTLQSSKTMVYGQSITPFEMTDNFVPDLDDNQFPLLLNEVKALAYFELKQIPHVKAEQEIKRQWSTVQKNKSIDNKPSHFDQLPDFGRVPRTGGFCSGGYGAYKWMRQTGP